MKIVIAGPGCPKCQMTEKNVREACNQLNISAEISHITDFREIAKLGVMLTPALIIEGKVVSSGGVPEVDDVKKSLLHRDEKCMTLYCREPSQIPALHI